MSLYFFTNYFFTYNSSSNFYLVLSEKDNIWNIMKIVRLERTNFSIFDKNLKSQKLSVPVKYVLKKFNNFFSFTKPNLIELIILKFLDEQIKN